VSENLVSGLKAINHRHVEVHENDLILDFAASLLSIGDKHIDGFLAAIGCVTDDAHVLQDYF